MIIFGREQALEVFLSKADPDADEVRIEMRAPDGADGIGIRRLRCKVRVAAGSAVHGVDAVGVSRV